MQNEDSSVLSALFISSSKGDWSCANKSFIILLARHYRQTVLEQTITRWQNATMHRRENNFEVPRSVIQSELPRQILVVMRYNVSCN